MVLLINHESKSKGKRANEEAEAEMRETRESDARLATRLGEQENAVEGLRNEHSHGHYLTHEQNARAQRKEHSLV
jgi:hypothetical protein